MTRPPVTLEWFHFCEYSFQTVDGKPGVIGIHDGIIVGQLPQTVPLGVAGYLRTAPYRAVDLVMTIQWPSGVKTLRATGRVTADVDGAAFFQMSFLMQVEEEGRYPVTLASASGDWSSPSRSIRVRLHPAPPTVTPLPS